MEKITEKEAALIISVLGISYQELSSIMGYAPGYISHVVNGDYTLSQKFTDSLLEVYRGKREEIEEKLEKLKLLLISQN